MARRGLLISQLSLPKQVLEKYQLFKDGSEKAPFVAYGYLGIHLLISETRKSEKRHRYIVNLALKARNSRCVSRQTCSPAESTSWRIAQTQQLSSDR